jgi:hypothetical protein
MMVPLGPTSTGQAVNQINSGSTRPMPSVAPRPVTPETMIWVAPRVVTIPGQGTVTVPGHWERRLPGTAEVHVPPLVVRPQQPGAPFTVPAGVRPPVEERFNSP